MTLWPTSRLTQRVIVYGGLVVAIYGCMLWMCRCPGAPRSTPPAGDLPAIAARLRADVTHLSVGIGERNVFYLATLDAAADWIVGRWKEFGLSPRSLPYEAAGKICRNIEVDVAGPEGAPVVLLGAHYDSVVGSPGADDNASGVACLLEVSRALAGADLPRRLRGVAFANEEPPFYDTPQMGSRVYARHARKRADPIEVMLSLETLGYFDPRPGSQRYPSIFSLVYPDRGDFVGVVGNIASRALVHRVTAILRAHTDIPVECIATLETIPGVNWSDHSSFWLEGYPAIMLTDTAPFRNPNYHTASDRAEHLDYPRFARLTAGIVDLVRSLAGGPGSPVGPEVRQAPTAGIGSGPRPPSR